LPLRWAPKFPEGLQILSIEGWATSDEEGEAYYIYLRSDAEVTIDFWFYTADVIRPTLGEL
jgi:hypothetical protein